MMSPKERSLRRKELREANLDLSREKDRIKARKQAAQRAEAAGLPVNVDFERPKAAPLTEDEKRERRRLKQAAWRAQNLERSREIVRESERRRAAARAVAEGREPGKKGPPKLYTEEEKRAKRNAKSATYNAAHLEETRKYARERARAIRAGTFVSRALRRLTEEEKRLVQIAMSAARRARVRGAGGTFTKEDIADLLIEQKGLCAICDEPFGADGYHIDHWKPLSRGGSNDPSNLKLTHPVCNLRKGAKTLDELGPLLVTPPDDQGT